MKLSRMILGISSHNRSESDFPFSLRGLFCTPKSTPYRACLLKFSNRFTIYPLYLELVMIIPSYLFAQSVWAGFFSCRGGAQNFKIFGGRQNSERATFSDDFDRPADGRAPLVWRKNQVLFQFCAFISIDSFCILLRFLHDITQMFLNIFCQLYFSVILKSHSTRRILEIVIEMTEFVNYES